MKRREFIKFMGAGAVGILLGGCGMKNDASPAVEKLEPVDVSSLTKFDGTVEYRIIPRTNTQVSTVGIGSSGLYQSSADEAANMVAYACENGINLIDTIMSDFTPAAAIGRALKGRRDKMVTQMHIGAEYPDNTYNRTRNLKDVQAGFEQQLKAMGTDYSDIGLIHYVDENSDFDRVMNEGIFEYALKLKQEGYIRNLGFASHSLDICQRFLATDKIDVFMFSMNPAYDFDSDGNRLVMSEERRSLYQECQKRGVAITAMKVYGGGRLLSDGTSPFGKAMNTAQCIQYALDRPAVVSCLAGVRNMNELQAALDYYKTDAAGRDYSFIVSSKHGDMEGVCLYCNHCQPCPVGIDIGAVNKYLDLAKAGDELAKDHYSKLTRKASDCTRCGACVKRCPFHVNVMAKMDEAVRMFGK